MQSIVKGETIMASLAPECVLNNKYDNPLSETELEFIKATDAYMFVLLATDLSDLERLPVFHSEEGKA